MIEAGLDRAMERRLAAILAADVVGYSRLMGRNEAGTLAALKAHRRELIEGEIARRGGRIISLTGDGMLVEFASVVAAVECAAAIQGGVAERAASRPTSASSSASASISMRSSRMVPTSSATG
jgi:adenylate cyclase